MRCQAPGSLSKRTTRGNSCLTLARRACGDPNGRHRCRRRCLPRHRRTLAASTRGWSWRRSEDGAPPTSWLCRLPSSAFELDSTVHLAERSHRLGTTFHAVEANGSTRFRAREGSKPQGRPERLSAQKRRGSGRERNGGAPQKRSSHRHAGLRRAASELAVSPNRFATIPEWGGMIPCSHPSHRAACPRSRVARQRNGSLGSATKGPRGASTEFARASTAEAACYACPRSGP
jgi:hypothetical protein